jgi:hypothetical protein
LPSTGRHPFAFALRNGESCCSIHAVDALVIHDLALPSQQGMQAAIAEAGSFSGQFSQPLDEYSIIFAPWLVADRGARGTHEPTGAAF